MSEQFGNQRERVTPPHSGPGPRVSLREQLRNGRSTHGQTAAPATVAAAPAARQPSLFPKRFRALARGISLFFLVIGLLAHFAPRETDQPVQPQIMENKPAIRSACGANAYVAAANLVDSAGPYPIYQIVCEQANGAQVVTQVAVP